MFYESTVVFWHFIRVSLQIYKVSRNEFPFTFYYHFIEVAEAAEAAAAGPPEDRCYFLASHLQLLLCIYSFLF